MIEDKSPYGLLKINTKNWFLILFVSLFFLFPTALRLSNVALLLIIVAWIFSFRNSNYLQIFKSTLVLWVLSAFYGGILINSIFSVGELDFIYLDLSKYVKLIYVVILVMILSGRKELQHAAMNAFIAAMMFILLSTWLNVYFLLPWSVTQEIGWGKSHHVVGDYITQNIMMAFFSIITIQRVVGASVRSHRIFWGVISALSVVSISHLSEGRTGLVLLAVGLLSYATVVCRGKQFFAGLLGVILLTGLVFITSGILENRFEKALIEAQQYNFDRETSIGHRLYNYETTVKLIAEKPIFGHGAGAYHTEICRFLSEKLNCSYFGWHPHNQFLFFWADYGVLGVIFYLLIIISLYRTALKSNNMEGKALLCALTSILLINSLFNSPLFSSRESQFFAYMMALLISMNQPPSMPAAR